MSPFERDGPQQSIHAERISVEQVAALYGYILVGVLGALFAAIILSLSLCSIGVVSFFNSVTFIVTISACTLLHLALRYFYWNSPAGTSTGGSGQAGLSRQASSMA